MNSSKYVPILKWKEGEKVALQMLRNDQKSSIIPLIEIIDDENPGEWSNSFKEVFNFPAYVDTQYLDGDDGTFLIKICEKNEIFCPVLYIDDFPTFSDKLYNRVKKIAVRIPVPEDLDEESHPEIFKRLNQWASGKDIKLDLILDLKFIKDKSSANISFRDLKDVIKNYVINSGVFNKIIISMTSFPEELSTLPAGESVYVDRYEIKIFKKLLETFPDLRGVLHYSDYGVTKFTDTEIDFSRLRHGILPKARYTIPDKYWILKGMRDRRTNQLVVNHQTHAKEIFTSEYYYGENFSFGDKEIKERAIGEKGPGNNKQWVTIAANHHIAVVIEELSNLYGSLA